MASFRPGRRAWARILVMAVVSVACAAIAWRASSASIEGASGASIHAAVAAIDQRDFLHHIEVLSSDEFEGRAPGTHGEALTVSYLEQQFKSIGLLPGSPNGRYTQRVPMTGFTGNPQASITIGTRHLELHYPDDFVAFSALRSPRVEIQSSELVFVGYGVIAPEYGWNDYKSLDVRGKTLVMLINDPPVPDPHDAGKLDDKIFGGKAMTYYGRWSYKYEIASKLGAAAAIIVHETGPAAYPYSVVVNSQGRENFTLTDEPGRARYPTIAAWITEQRARELFTACGLDFQTMKKAAVSRDFHPVPLGAHVHFRIDNT